MLKKSPERKLIGLPTDTIKLPNLIEIQIDSFEWFINKGIKESLEEIFPVDDFTGDSLILRIKDFYFSFCKKTGERAQY